MKLGLQIARFDWPGSPQNLGPKLIEIAQAADQAGFSSLWVMDRIDGAHHLLREMGLEPGVTGIEAAG